MTTIRKTLTFTDQQDKWIKAQIEAGEFTNESEYIRHLVRLDQERRAKFQELKSAIREGVESGPGSRSMSDIVKGVEEKLKADGKL